MVKSYKSQSFMNGLKFSCINAIRANKIKLIISFIFIVVAISTGVFVAIRSHRNCSLYCLQEINLESFYTGFAASSSAFFSRCFSLCINFVLITGFAFVPSLFPLTLVLVVYRSYLFGLNFVLIFIFYGVGSIFTAVVIVLPCQLLTIFAMVAYYLVLQQIICNFKKYGCAEFNKNLFIICGLVFFLLINLAETLLLFFLNGRVILVI